jgi:chromosomal replication initiator protein
MRRVVHTNSLARSTPVGYLVEKVRALEGAVEEIDEIWGRCSLALRESVSDAVWQMWLSKVTAVELSGDNLVLGVPNSVVRARVNDRFLGLIRDAVTVEAGRPLEVGLMLVHDEEVVDLDLNVPSTDGELPLPAPAPAPSLPTSASASASASARATGTVRLDSRFTFDSFVAAPSNRLALAAAQTVAETPGRAYNPLFIYGASGLGKTHLLHAIGNWVIQNYPRHRVLYVTTETFLNDFVDAMRSRTTVAFKRHYRECDVLLIDDVQFMENKEGLQEELFHTYNTLHGEGKQIVLTSDRPPKSIQTLEDRLRSRLLSGLMAEIDPPDIETRLAILRTKASNDRVELPDDVAEYIATNVKDNIRELEGALTRVAAFASLSQEPISMELTHMVLSDLGNETKPITPDVILNTVAAHYGLTVDDLISPTRTRPLVEARHVAMYLMRTLTDYSYPAIGKAFGGRDHTTCIAAYEKIAGKMMSDRKIYDQVNALLLEIKGSS